MANFRRLLVYLILAGCVMMVGTNRDSARAQTRPTGATALSADPLGAFKLNGKQSELGKLEISPVQGQPFSKSLRLATIQGPEHPWSLQAQTPNATPIKKGDVLLARFQMRCVESMTGDGFTGLVFEEAGGDFQKDVDVRFGAASEWRQFDVPFIASRDYAPGEAQLVFRAGYDRQTIEIAAIELLNYGKSAKLEELPRTRMDYPGRAADAAWRKEALARIERIRKGDLKVRVTDAAGKPVAGATVAVELKRHQFGFGSCVTMELLTADTPEAARYREIVEKNFNLAVFENDMKWPALYEGVPPKLDEALAWLQERKIAVRGHNLVWPSWRWLPRGLKQYENDPETLRSITAKHITDTVTHFKGKLTEWDVVNEVYTNHDLVDILGRDSVNQWFQLARAADPTCKLVLNDYGIIDGGGTNHDHQNAFYNEIKRLKDSGAPIDVVGIQSHFGSDLTALPVVLKIFDRFSEFGLPIVSTELSLNLIDADLQADYMRDYMIAAFSHPNIEGIMLWGFWEKRHWRPQGALWKADFTPKPVAKAWIDLVHNQWKTRTSATTNGVGSAEIRGFFGEYEVRVTAPGRSDRVLSTSLTSGSPELRIILD